MGYGCLSPFNTWRPDWLDPYRGSVYKTKLKDEEGNVAEKDSLGRIKLRVVDENDNVDRRNYQKGDNINYMDGDTISESTYNYGVTSMIDNKAMVYKGGSWKDRSYWLTAGTRRFLDEKQSTNAIGFRCAMIRTGSPVGMGAKKRNKGR